MSKELEYLDEVRARGAAATPGAWQEDKTVNGVIHVRSTANGVLVSTSGGFRSDHDAAFIAHSRADVDRLQRFARAAIGFVTWMTTKKVPGADAALAILREENNEQAT